MLSQIKSVLFKRVYRSKKLELPSKFVCNRTLLTASAISLGMVVPETCEVSGTGLRRYSFVCDNAFLVSCRHITAGLIRVDFEGGHAEVTGCRAVVEFQSYEVTYAVHSTEGDIRMTVTIGEELVFRGVLRKMMSVSRAYQCLSSWHLASHTWLEIVSDHADQVVLVLHALSYVPCDVSVKNRVAREILSLLRRYSHHASVVARGLGAYEYLNMLQKDTTLSHDGLEVILKAMETHVSVLSVQVNGCKLLALFARNFNFGDPNLFLSRAVLACEAAATVAPNAALWALKELDSALINVKQ